MNVEMFWSCVGAILFCGGLRVAIMIVITGLDTYLKSKIDAGF